MKKYNNKSSMVYSLTTSYPKSSKNLNQFVHLENLALVKAGYNVKTITHHHKGSKKKEVIEGVEVIRFQYLPESLEIETSIPEAVWKSKMNLFKVIILFSMYFFVTLKECIKKQPDVFLGHWVFPSGYICYIMAKLFKKKFVVAFHGGEVSFIQKFKFLRKIIIPCLNKADTIIANSSFTMKEFQKMGVNNPNMIRVTGPPNYINHSAKKDELDKFRKKITKPSNKIILFVGRFVELKGVEFLIKALPQIKTQNIHLLLVGKGILQNQLEEIVSELDINDKVSFFGHANFQQLELLYGVSDLFVLPSIIDSKGATEGMGLVLLEAMDAKIPIIATKVGGIPEIVINENNGILVKEKDSKGIASAIDRILNDSELANKFIKNAKKKTEEFSLKTTSEGYINIIKRVLES